jgi:hypothetical protein
MKDMHGFSTSEPRQRTLSGLLIARHARAGDRRPKERRVPHTRALTRQVNAQLRQNHRNAVHPAPSGTLKPTRTHAKKMKTHGHRPILQHMCHRIQMCSIMVILYDHLLSRAES